MNIDAILILNLLLEYYLLHWSKLWM